MSDYRREQIQRRVSAYRDKLAEIRDDPNLSPVGRRRAIEQLHTTTKADIDPLRKELAQQQDKSRTTLERKLFGLPANADPSTAILFRDAQDRVASIRKPEQLADLMERAHTSGDDTLLRAAAHRAWQQSRNALASDTWGNLVAEYAHETGMAADFDAFTQASTSLGATQAMAEQMSMSLPTPKELNTPESMLAGDGAAA